MSQETRNSIYTAFHYEFVPIHKLFEIFPSVSKENIAKAILNME